uniref:GDSL esterase/lipase n=1 Tax=Triticum urartu TaxID=4572 RepID=A0A8R7PR30_TRIUA
MSFVLDVIRTISTAIERLIKHGATNFVVPRTIPSGCAPPVLALFPDAAPAEYNSTTGCLEDINKLGMHHNLLLQEALKKLRGRHPGGMIVYADLFGPIMDMVELPRKYGFEDVLTICCGGPGTLFCGDEGANLCEKPAACLFWDGVHLTEAAYHYIADVWLDSMDSPAI